MEDLKMTKQAWLEHASEAGYFNLSEEDRKNHVASCDACQSRRKTKRATRRRQDRDEAYRSSGLVKVRGALGGIYWE
jgi:hypothetical protein